MVEAIPLVIFKICYFVAACIFTYALVRLNEFRIAKSYFLLREWFVLTVFASAFCAVPILCHHANIYHEQTQDKKPIVVFPDGGIKVAKNY